MTSRRNRPKPGDMVFLTEIPPGLLDGLPPEDQEAIADVKGKLILLWQYDENDRAELEFTDRNGVIHSIFVRPDFIARDVKADG